MSHKEKTIEITKKETLKSRKHQIILWNDDVNTFDFVIESLIKICDHDEVQAEQCAFIVHFNGKCPVKTGSMSDLKPRCEKLLSLGLTASIK